MSIRIVIVDDQAMVRAGLRLILEFEPDMRVVGEAGNGREAVVLARSLRPDVILMDVQMPALDGIAATRQIIEQDPDRSGRILILTMFERDEYIFGALRAGASGFLLKNAPPEDLIEAVRTISAGDSLLAPSVTRRIIAEFVRLPARATPAKELKSLTERETETLRLLARGLTNAEIATTFFVSESTVKTHVSSMLAKLNLRDRTQAVVFAYESGLVRPGGR
jgi:DNA-binding NarL/FixJ family response regulator